MKIPSHTKQLYIDFFNFDYGLISECLTWAYPNTYKIYVYDNCVISDLSITDQIIGVEMVRLATDSIRRTYVLMPGTIKQI